MMLFCLLCRSGIQVGAENFLLPTNEVFETEFDVMDNGVSVQNIMRYSTGMTNQVNVLILDACRDNPFEWELEQNEVIERRRFSKDTTTNWIINCFFHRCRKYSSRWGWEE